MRIKQKDKQQRMSPAAGVLAPNSAAVLGGFAFPSYLCSFQIYYHLSPAAAAATPPTSDASAAAIYQAPYLLQGLSRL